MGRDSKRETEWLAKVEKGLSKINRYKRVRDLNILDFLFSSCGYSVKTVKLKFYLTHFTTIFHTFHYFRLHMFVLLECFWLLSSKITLWNMSTR